MYIYIYVYTYIYICMYVFIQWLLDHTSYTSVRWSSHPRSALFTGTPSLSTYSMMSCAKMEVEYGGWLRNLCETLETIGK